MLADTRPERRTRNRAVAHGGRDGHSSRPSRAVLPTQSLGGASSSASPRGGRRSSLARSCTDSASQGQLDCTVAGEAEHATFSPGAARWAARPARDQRRATLAQVPLECAAERSRERAGAHARRRANARSSGTGSDARRSARASRAGEEAGQLVDAHAAAAMLEPPALREPGARGGDGRLAARSGRRDEVARAEPS